MDTVYDEIKNWAAVAQYTGARSFAAKQVCFGPVKAYHVQILLEKVELLSALCNKSGGFIIYGDGLLQQLYIDVKNFIMVKT